MNGQILRNIIQVVPFTGLETCNTFEKQPIGIILTNADYYIPANVTDKGNAILVASSNVKITGDRVYPLLEGLVNFEPTGGDTRISQEGFGSAMVNGHNPYQEILTFTKGGMCLFKQLRKIHGQDMRVFFVDEDYNVYGTEDDSGKTRGFLANFGVTYRKNLGSTLAALKVHLLYANTYSNEFVNITSFSVSDTIKGIRGVELYDVDLTAAEHRVNFKLRIECSRVQVKPIGIIPHDVVLYTNGVNMGNPLTATMIDAATGLYEVTYDVDAVEPDHIRIEPYNGSAFISQLVSINCGFDETMFDVIEI